jgi:hypothetical protein
MEMFFLIDTLGYRSVHLFRNRVPRCRDRSSPIGLTVLELGRGRLIAAYITTVDYGGGGGGGNYDEYKCKENETAGVEESA